VIKPVTTSGASAASAVAAAYCVKDENWVGIEISVV